MNAYRRDVADVALADRLFAPHYARPLVQGCGEPRVAIRSAPDEAAVAVSELLLGERFAVVDIAGGWAWGYGCHDRYVGYVPLAALDAELSPTHIVSAAAALVFAEADIKAPVLARLPLGARVAARDDGAFLAAQGGWVHPRHLTALDKPEGDPVAVAERLLGTPYRWGGRSGDGIDCSGLVQTALMLCGIAAPRDSDQQLHALGRLLRDDEPARRGDLVFFPGHVGFMADGARLIHANAHAMAVSVEPLADVVARLAPRYAAPLVARRRIET